MDAKEFIKKLDTALDNGDTNTARKLLQNDAVRTVAASLLKPGDRSEFDKFISTVSARCVKVATPTIRDISRRAEKRENEAIEYLRQGDNDAAAKSALIAVKLRHAERVVRSCRNKMSKYIRNPGLASIDEFAL